MSLLYFKCGLFALSMLFAALFAFLETSFTSLRLFKVKELAEGMSRFRSLFDAWEYNPRRILITILIAANIADVLASVLITDIVQSFLGDTGAALAIGVALATIMLLVVGEIIPKSYAKAHPESFFGPFLWLINILFYLFTPIVAVLTYGTDWLTRRFGGEKVIRGDTVTEKEIEFLIDYGDEKGMIDAEKSEMLQNIFSLGQTMVKEVMVPETDMIVLNVNDSLEKAMDTLIQYRFTRIPVYEGKESNIIGIIHQKDIFEILHAKKGKSLADLVMPILFVPETKKVHYLLQEFLKKRIHMAIVLDEYGAVMGLVTLEDIIEEIVGEISDEHERVEQEIVTLDEGGCLVDARIELKKLEDFLKIKLPVLESVTLGGFLAEKLQHLPKKGERVEFNGYCFQIQKASSKRVEQVLIFQDA